MYLTIELYQEKDKVLAKCRELNISIYGENENEATEKLKNIIYFYFESLLESFSNIKINPKEIN